MQKLWQWIRRSLMVAVCLIVLLLLVGICYKYVTTQINAKRYPPPGEMVDIGGYKMHLQCAGKGGPTVILDAGCGCTSLSWSLVQPQIAQFTRVCSYDRAGYPWSEQSPLKRSSKNMAVELHALLHIANVPGPYILVGSSLGGINARLYAAMYPEDVTGLILVDSPHEDSFKRIAKIEPKQNPYLIKFLWYTGLQGIILQNSSRIKAFLSPLSQEAQKQYIVVASTNQFLRTELAEPDYFREDLDDIKNSPKIPDNIPVFVIAAGLAENIFSDSEKQKEIDKQFLVLFDLQRDLVKKYPNSKFFIAEKSSHLINHYQPEIIVEAVKEMIDNCRSVK
jgi:pimeloyl-ACP methyl ester carboxylesterase